jgi:hypothetical protein
MDAAAARDQQARSGALAVEQGEAEEAGGHGRRDGHLDPVDRGAWQTSEPTRRSIVHAWISARGMTAPQCFGRTRSG